MPQWTSVELAPRLTVLLEAEGDALRRAWLGASGRAVPSGFRAGDRRDGAPLLRQAARELQEYMAGRRKTFSVPFELDGTHFQCRVWAELFKIPYGELRTYGEIARALGNPGAGRAAGAANARNPLPIIIPCHRVIASDGTLGGYSAGLEVKRLLLAVEGIRLPASPAGWLTLPPR